MDIVPVTGGRAILAAIRARHWRGLDITPLLTTISAVATAGR